MALVEGHHVIAWSSLTLIEKLSPENLSNRSVGYLQNLTPVISKLMPYALTEERKVRVLKVLQVRRMLNLEYSFYHCCSTYL